MRAYSFAQGDMGSSSAGAARTTRRIVRTMALPLLAACTTSEAAAAQQQTTGTASVRGLIRDSLHRAPLQDAIVQLFLDRDHAGSVKGLPSVRTVVTGRDGAFAFDSLMAGAYLVGFQHPVIETFRLPDRVYPLTVRADTQFMILATPSPTAMFAAVCADSSRGGALAGLVTSVRSGMPVANAVVRVAPWTGDGDAQETRSLADGSYRFCGVAPGDKSFEIQARGLRTLQARVVVAERTMTHLLTRLGDADVANGDASLHVRLADSLASRSVAIRLGTLNRAFRMEGDEMLMRGLPAGTVSVSLRSLGSYPIDTLLTLEPGTTTTLDARRTRAPQLLSERQTIAEAWMDRTLRDALDIRRRLGFGTIIYGDDWRFQSADRPSSVLRYARGFMNAADRVVARPYFAHGRLQTCANIKGDDSVMMAKSVIVYLDGFRYLGSLEAIDTELKPGDIAAVEAYPDVTFAPVQWRTGDACAVVAFWTKR